MKTCGCDGGRLNLVAKQTRSQCAVGEALLKPNAQGRGDLSEEMEEIFQCKKCGTCCQGETTVSLDSDDIAAMLGVLQMEPAEAEAKYWRVNGGTIQMKTIDGHCIFYNDGCTIHAAKPWRCSQWPLHPSILTEPSSFAIIRAACPGINQELRYEEFCNRLRAWLAANDQAMAGREQA